MILGATLYVNNSNEAVEFYCEAFRMKIGYNAKNENGTYLHAELEKNGNSIFAVSESTDFSIKDIMLNSKTPTMSLGINFDDDEELKYAYNKLIIDGHIIRPLGSLPWSPCAADVVDKYGVCWYIYVSQHKPE
jgi:PhnB protein